MLCFLRNIGSQRIEASLDLPPFDYRQREGVKVAWLDEAKISDLWSASGPIGDGRTPVATHYAALFSGHMVVHTMACAWLQNARIGPNLICSHVKQGPCEKGLFA